jgi:hypothetical protein
MAEATRLLEGSALTGFRSTAVSQSEAMLALPLPARSNSATRRAYEEVKRWPNALKIQVPTILAKLELS